LLQEQFAMSNKLGLVGGKLQHVCVSVSACLLAFLLLMGAATEVGAQGPASVVTPGGSLAYPTRPIELVIPFPAGGAQDVLARLLAEQLTRQMGVDVSVNNRPGSHGALASERVAKAAPDGHVLLMQQASLAFQIGHDTITHDIREFAPVGRAAIAPQFLVIDDRIPAQTLSEWFTLVRAYPHAYSYGYGAGSGLAWLYTDRAVRDGQVPRLEAKSEAAVVQDILAGRVSACFCTLPSVDAQVRKGKLRILAVAGQYRSSIAPSVPTLRESGYDGYVSEQWLGVLVPTRTPSVVVHRLANELRRALTGPDVRERLARVGLAPVLDTPHAFATTLHDDAAHWQRPPRTGMAERKIE
jgi:tripartite-type tricarboxylate transporter receptor subunit TctC